MRRSGRLACGSLLLPILLPACQGPGVPLAELPDAPLAIAWRAPQAARERAARLMAASDPVGESRRQERRWGRLGVVPLDELQPLLGGVAGVSAGPEDDADARLALLDPRSGALTPIRAARPGARPVAWSPRRQRLLFSQPERGALQLFEYHLARGEVRPRTAGPEAHPAGCYGSGGRLVVTRRSTRDGRPLSQIALTRPGGEPPEPISPGPDDHSPSCAPDGSAVAYVSTPASGRPQLFAVSLEGERRTRRLGPGRDPSFSPDGRWVVFSAPVGERWQLWRIGPDGRGRAPVGRGALDEIRPAVSPDGRHVAYVVERDFRSTLYLRRLDGSGDRILFREGDVESPVW